MRMLVGHKPCHKRMPKRTALKWHQSLNLTLLPEDQEVASDEEDVKESGPESDGLGLRIRTQYMQICRLYGM